MSTLRKRSGNETFKALLFLSPALLVFFVLVLFPVLFSGYLAFTDWKFTSGLKGFHWIGINNFVKLFNDRTFNNALKNTFVYTLTCVPPNIIIALFLANALNRRVYFQKLLRTFVFIPYISNMVALALLFRCLFLTNGVINSFLIEVIGLENGFRWIASNDLNKVPVILLSVWASIGYSLVVYMAAMQNVSSNLYEAARIDGASERQCFWRITVPLVSPTTFFLFIIRMIAVFKIFTSINVINNATIARGNVSIVLSIYQDAFRSYKFGYASAEAWILFIIIFATTLIQFWGKKKWVYNY